MRLVVTKRNSGAVNFRRGDGAGTEIPQGSYRGRMMKYIPVEILVLYVAVYGTAYATTSSEPYFSLAARWILILGITGTVLWLWKVEGVNDAIQLATSTAGFFLWAVALGVVPVTDLPGYNQIAASLALPLYVFLSPLIEGIPARW